VNPRVKVQGAKTYPPKGDVLLLFVRERARVNVWRYVQARLDPEIDLFKEKDILQGSTPQQLRTQAEVDMANAQRDAKVVALETVGYKLPVEPGAFVRETVPGTPAGSALQHGDVILSVDGKPLRKIDDLSKAIKLHRAGEQVTLTVRRNGRVRTIRVATKRDRVVGIVIGVSVSSVYKLPVNISIDTSDIGGPSAGLAMTLAVIDDLTPGNLTGGKQVAVTGTISENGQVGEIGGIEQKAVAAKAAGAQLFIVPKCTDPQGRAGCQAELARARKRSGNTPVVPVANVAEALSALSKAGGDPVRQVAKAA
jgi:PDZ domain-containing protein